MHTASLQCYLHLRIVLFRRARYVYSFTAFESVYRIVNLSLIFVYANFDYFDFSELCT